MSQLDQAVRIETRIVPVSAEMTQDAESEIAGLLESGFVLLAAFGDASGGMYTFVRAARPALSSGLVVPDIAWPTRRPA